MIQKFLNKILHWGPFLAFINFTKRIKPPGFQGLSVHYVAKFFWDSISKGALVTRASAISFKLIMASIPGMIVLISAIPLLFPDFTFRMQQAMSTFLPKETMLLLNPYLDQLFSKGGTIVSVGFLLAIYYSSSAFQSILSAFSRSVHITERRNIFTQRLVSLAVIGIIALFIITALGSITGIQWLIDFLEEKDILTSSSWTFVLYALTYVLIFFLFLLAISTLYNIGNPERKKWRFTSVGAVVSSILMILVSVGFAYYVNNFGNYNKLYGSIGAILVFFFWIYYNSLILLIGFELNLSIYTAKEE
ncbi:MAG: YihY/virulence factor BrkB family protein, partial [Bacteroidota bacterium]